MKRLYWNVRTSLSGGFFLEADNCPYFINITGDKKGQLVDSSFFAIGDIVSIKTAKKNARKMMNENGIKIVDPTDIGEVLANTKERLEKNLKNQLLDLITKVEEVLYEQSDKLIYEVDRGLYDSFIAAIDSKDDEKIQESIDKLNKFAEENI